MILMLKVALQFPKNDVLKTRSSQIILKDFKVPFFHGPSSAVNFECQVLSVEPDHDYEIEKLC